MSSLPALLPVVHRDVARHTKPWRCMPRPLHVVGVHLWKELREQRHAIVTMGAAMSALLWLVLWRMPEAAQTYRVGWFMLQCFALAALLAVGPDMVLGETQRRRLELLDRLPAGLGTALVAKSLLLIAVVAAYVALAAAQIQVGQRLLCAQPLLPPTWAALDVAWWTRAIPSVALWTLAIASCVKRSSGLVVAIAAALLLVVSASITVQPLARHAGQWQRFDVLHLALAPIAAVLAFVVGRRRAGTLRRAALGAGACAAALVLPFAAPAAKHLLWPVDPHAPDFTIRGGFLGASAAHAFLHVAIADGELHALTVDLQRGTWRHEARGNGFVLPRVRHGGVTTGLEPGLHAEVWLTPDCRTWRVIDGASGAVVGYGSADTDWNGYAREARLRQSLRAGTPIRLPDGRAAWFHDRMLEQDAADGGVERVAGWVRGDVPHTLAGFGVRIFEPRPDHGAGRYRLFDLARGKRYAWSFVSLGDAWVLPDAWLVRGGERRQRPPLPHGWWRLDPETGATRPAAGIEATDRVVTVLDDGRVLTQATVEEERRARARSRASQAQPVPPGRVQIVDVATGQRWPIALPAGGGALRDPGDPCAPARTPGGTRLLMAIVHDPALLRPAWPGTTALLRLDAAACAFGVPVPCDTLLACPDEDTAIVISGDRRRIERVRLDGGVATEVLWPRPQVER